MKKKKGRFGAQKWSATLIWRDFHYGSRNTKNSNFCLYSVISVVRLSLQQ